MEAYNKFENRLVVCPYDEAHKLKESRLQLHIAKCKLNHLDKVMETCPFNATHVFAASERDYHLLNCPDKAPLDRQLAQALDKNNPYNKGRTAVPAFSDPQPVYSEENWDEDFGATAPASPPQPRPPVDAIIEPPPLSKPAFRRNLYKELHKMKTVPEKKDPVPPSPQPPKQSPAPRQPKEACGAEKKQHQQSLQNMPTAGVGRGKPPTRIAANIYEKPASGSGQPSAWNVSSQPSAWNVSGQASAWNVSGHVQAGNGLTNSFQNLGLGRGQRPSQGAAPTLDDDDEFPALGCGRGAFKTTKQNPRIPGARIKN